jgi:hypothetical protein
MAKDYDYRGLVAEAWDLLRGDTSAWADRACYRAVIERDLLHPRDPRLAPAFGPMPAPASTRSGRDAMFHASRRFGGGFG